MPQGFPGIEMKALLIDWGVFPTAHSKTKPTGANRTIAGLFSTNLR